MSVHEYRCPQCGGTVDVEIRYTKEDTWEYAADSCDECTEEANIAWDQ